MGLSTKEVLENLLDDFEWKLKHYRNKYHVDERAYGFQNGSMEAMEYVIDEIKKELKYHKD